MSNTPWIFINRTLGLSVPVRVPFSTTEEYDRLTGAVGQWREDLAALNCYSKFNATFGDKLAAALKQLTGEEIPASGKKTEDGTDIPVTVKVFIRKLQAEQKLTQAMLEEVAAKVAAEMPDLDITPTSKASSKAPKEFLIQAAQLLAALAQKGRSVEDWFEAISNKFPNPPQPDEEEGFSENFIGRVLQHVSRVQASSLAGA